MVTIGDEIENIKRYLYIQQIRYSDRIKYSMDVDDDILQYKLPALTLQPIVENSVIHGLKDKKEKGEVNIRGKLAERNTITLEVYDNGVGIDNDKIVQLLSLNHDDLSSAGLGICNVNKRIKHLFGHEFGVDIKSINNENTRVIITIPCKD
jgi:sensor histidine kinase YesM